LFIRNVDEGLETLIRARLPLPEEIGDVSFDTPNKNWSAQLSRLTVNLFLFDVHRSTQPGRGPQHRVDADGRAQRRAPQPMIELGYLVSAWAGSPRDEHLLLGDLVSLLAGTAQLPREHAAADVPIQLSVGSVGPISAREIWQGVGGDLKAAVLLTATASADTWDWTDEAPAVQRISTLLAPKG
jgi:hypothetical protein